MSMCCSVIVRNSSHFRPPCTPVTEEGGSSQSSQLNATMHSAPTDCTLRIPASSSNSRRKRPLVSYELSTCAGSNLHVVCEANLSCSDRGVSWRREGEVSTFQGRDLRINDVQRRDSGAYACEVTDYFGKKRVGAVVVVIAQFPPMLTVPKPRIGRPLECSAEAEPPAIIMWYRDDAPLSPAHHDWYIVTSETANCTTRSRLLPPVMESNSTSPDPTEGNFTCVASNRHGQTSATLIFPGSQDEFVSPLPADTRRRFNVTGFIVGMLPPLFISFYIIVKLGYRSRYAEERGEDDGFREEPFFIGY